MSSSDQGKAEAVKWILDNLKPGDTALDVGAGDGKWAALLKGYLLMDAVEVFWPNISNHELYKKYHNTYIADIRDFKYTYYDLIIFGDVLEHMTVQDAQNVINYARARCLYMLVAVPFNWPQGAIYGNPYEVHIQPDLTPELFNKRYPGFKCIYQTYNYGYYILDNSEAIT